MNEFIVAQSLDEQVSVTINLCFQGDIFRPFDFQHIRGGPS